MMRWMFEAAAVLPMACRAADLSLWHAHPEVDWQSECLLLASDVGAGVVKVWVGSGAKLRQVIAPTERSG
jgi:hypothetical protein